MLTDRNRQPKRRSRLQAAVFVLAGLLALLTIGLGTSFAESSEEEGGGTTDPVIVPETETPPVTNPAPTPAEPSTPVTSAPAPSVRPTESGSTGSSGSRSSSPSTGTHGSSGGSAKAPTQVNNGLAGSDGGSGGDGGGGSTEGGGSSTSAPTGSTSPSTTTQSTSGVEKAATALAERAGQSTGADKKARQDAVKKLGEAVGKQLLGGGVTVSKPKAHDDGVADFVPLPGKSKTLYFLLILVILAIASFVVWTQFRGPRASRRRKAHIDHRVASAARLTPAERVRARQWSTEHARRSRTARRKAA